MRLIDADLLLNDLPCKRVMSMCLNIDVCHGYNSCIDSVTKCIKNQPNVNEWILCSERLPEEFNDEYLVTFNNGVVSSLIYTDDKQWADIQYCHYTNMVIAWQPLPEPYEVPNESR